MTADLDRHQVTLDGRGGPSPGVGARGIGLWLDDRTEARGDNGIRATVPVVDDDAGVRLLLKNMLACDGHQVVTADSGRRWGGYRFLPAREPAREGEHDDKNTTGMGEERHIAERRAAFHSRRARRQIGKPALPVGVV